MSYRIIVAGSRDFCDYFLLRETLDTYLSDKTDVTLISGTAKGADRLGERYAEERGIPILRCPADWKRYKRGAGAKRNEDMARLAVENGAHGALFAFWDGVSTGTRQMIKIAEEYGLSVNIIRF